MLVAVPPILLATAVNVTGPAGSEKELHDQAPVPALAVVVQDWLLGPSKVTLAPAVAIPLTVIELPTEVPGVGL